MRLADRAVIEVARETAPVEPLRQVWRRASASQWCRMALCLLGAALLDWILAPGGAGRLLYLVPVWLMAERHSRGIAYVAAAAGPLLHFLCGRGIDSAPAVGLILHVTLGFVLVSRLEGQRIRTAKIAREALEDPLTKVPNRKGIEKYADREIKDCITHGRPLTLAILDCDQFKPLNDIHGHAFGDDVLVTLADIVSKEIGARGKVGRTGGDEFVAIFPGLPQSEAQYYLDRAVRAFSDATFLMGAKTTFSVGYAVNEHGKGLDALLKKADEDLYVRKANKRAPAEFAVPA